MNFLVPEYYKHFKCKCGECRHSCCDGWPISITMKEYFSLLGSECSTKLRAKLDCALKICFEPSNECYAQISADWQGICMLHREDGLCLLQVEHVETGFPEVCRLYPRNSKQLMEVCKCSCSNSCEEVVELLINLKEPLQFEVNDLILVPAFKINLSSKKVECCNKSISIIQNRSLTLPERFMALGNFLHGTELYFKEPDNLSLAILLLSEFNKYFENRISISDYCKASQSYFGMEANEKLSSNDLNIIEEKYIKASVHLESFLPDWPVLFEQLIVNHMFYNNFPYIDNREKVNEAFLSLASMYSFLRFNILGYMSDKTNREDLVDYLAAMFRLIEHSSFDNIVLNLYMKEKFVSQDCMMQLFYV